MQRGEKYRSQIQSEDFERRPLSLAAEGVYSFAQKWMEIFGENDVSDFGAFLRVYIQEEKRGGTALSRHKKDKTAPGPDQEQLWDTCTEYFGTCDALGRKPTWQGLAGHAGVTSAVLSAWLREEGEAGGALQKAADFISDRLQQRTDSMAVLSVKQPLYGGFLDRAQGTGGEGTVSIVVTMGGKKESSELGK